MSAKVKNIGDYIPASAQITLSGEEYVTFITVAKEHEQERILNLLDNPLHHNIQSPDIHEDCYTCVLVKLIKGENK